MRSIIVLFTITIAFPLAVLGQTQRIKVGSTTRNFLVHVPSSGLPENPALVIDMHGVNSTPSEQQSRSGFDKVADREKFIVVFPEGITQSIMPHGWDIPGNSDVDFISALIDTFANRYKIDRQRVYATGFSMGGMMSYKLACVATDKIAALGSVSGYPLADMMNSCTPLGSLPICHVHGASDGFVPYSGVTDWLSNFIEPNECPGSPTITNPSSKVKKEYWGPCKDGCEIVLYSISGWSHDYPNSSSAGFSPADTFWAFFSNYPGATGATNRVVNARTQQSFSVKYSAGRIRLKDVGGNPYITSVRIFDALGKSILSRYATTDLVGSLEFPINHSASGVYFVTIESATGNSIFKTLIP